MLSRHGDPQRCIASPEPAAHDWASQHARQPGLQDPEPAPQADRATHVASSWTGATRTPCRNSPVHRSSTLQPDHTRHPLPFTVLLRSYPCCHPVGGAAAAALCCRAL